MLDTNPTYFLITTFLSEKCPSLDNNLRDHIPKIKRRKFFWAQEGFKEGYPESFTFKKCKYLNVVECWNVIWVTGSSETRNNRIMQKIDDEYCYIYTLLRCLAFWKKTILSLMKVFESKSFQRPDSHFFKPLWQQCDCRYNATT